MSTEVMRTSMKRTVALLVLGVMLQPVFAETSQPPNFLLLLADDISASHLGCYGALNPGTTPHIDRLANQGLSFMFQGWGLATALVQRRETLAPATTSSAKCQSDATRL